ncbi:hypothetical protein ACIGEZ_16635 [Streptomyces sp. NPDC085481]|uniref:hypothetical protein n=1 Tax=Streptomyces sp. NPDC085481 TaxID=3365727 RepID=UPI0037D8079F
MTYVVTVETCIPDGAPQLDELRRVGVVALLERGFDSVAGVEGPDGVEVDVLDVVVGAHSRGAVLKVFVEAPSLEVAEDAVGSVAQEVLERTEVLAEWVVESSEVKLHTDLAHESLAAADGPDAPPSDPQARRAQLARQPADEPFELAEEAQDPEGEIRAMAVRLRSFGPEAFGVDEPADERGVRPASAELAAGALVYATEVLIDELYDDVLVLAEEDSTVAGCEGQLWHLDQLPARYAATYDELFARRFLVTAVALTTRFTDGGFRRLGCLADELVLKFLLEQAHVTLDLYGLLDDEVATALECFAAGVFEGVEFERLYDETGETARPADAAEPAGTPEDGDEAGAPWFTPFGEDRYVHPYASDQRVGEEAEGA